ncbi:MAG: hypothetical protein GX025_05040, partial [Clostridiales bacterium]|nr:hypothetical protein [Clostridiales bacterium]
MQYGSRNPKTIVSFLGLIIFSFMLLVALYNQLSLSEIQGGESSVSALPYFRVSANGEDFEDIWDFQKRTFDLPRGSVVELHGYLPYEEDYDTYAICFLNYYCGVEVFCGDKLIHSYGEPSSQLVLGSGYHYIMLPADYYLKEICIRLTVTVPSSLFSTSSLLFGQWETLYMHHIKQSPITFFMDIFMLVLGIVLILISMAGILYRKRFLIITWVGAIAFVAGTWTLCNSKFIQPFIPNHDITVHIEFQSFYLILLLLLLYFRSINSKNQQLKKICNQVLIFSSVVIFIIELLQFLDIRDYPE